jgi:hypothetical protein
VVTVNSSDTLRCCYSLMIIVLVVFVSSYVLHSHVGVVVVVVVVDLQDLES